MRRKSGVIVALGLIAASAGIGIGAAQAAAAQQEAQYEYILGLPTEEAMRAELALVFADDPYNPLVAVLLDRIVEKTQAMTGTTTATTTTTTTPQTTSATTESSSSTTDSEGSSESQHGNGGQGEHEAHSASPYSG